MIHDFSEYSQEDLRAVLQTLLDSPGWAYVELRLSEQIAMRMQMQLTYDLWKEETLTEARVCQLERRTFEVAKRLPQMLLDECNAELKNERTAPRNEDGCP